MNKKINFHNINKYCEQCGKGLKLNRNRDIERKRFCSRSCLAIYNQKNDIWNRKKAAKTVSIKMMLGLIPKPPKRQKTKFYYCEYCGKELKYKGNRCRDCYIEQHTTRCIDCGKKISKNSKRCHNCNIIFKNKNSKKKEFKCVVCGKKFTRWNSQVKNIPSCSRHCAASYYGRLNRKTCNFYIDGRTSLRKLIKTSGNYVQWVKKVFIHDKYKCVKCNSNKNIQAHHKIHFSNIFSSFLDKYKKYNPNNDCDKLLNLAYNYEPFWNSNNGITLCRDCHQNIHPEVTLYNKRKETNVAIASPKK